jgi:hypothetical protein
MHFLFYYSSATSATAFLKLFTWHVSYTRQNSPSQVHEVLLLVFIVWPLNHSLAADSRR